ncbi:MAG: DinB family protein [Acidobacteria bacterium]|nr:DinB family protein [Acidobacteriota bacterium]
MNERIGKKFDRLEGVRRGIEARIDGLESDALNMRPSPGSWSAAQAIGHIVLAEERTLEYIGKKLSDPSRLRPAGLKERFKGRLVTLVMGVPIRFRAPEIVAHVADHHEPADLLARWARVRGDLGALLDSVPVSLLDTCLYKHPAAGPMTLADALDFMTAHSSRHAKQIERILREVVRR